MSKRIAIVQRYAKRASGLMLAVGLTSLMSCKTQFDSEPASEVESTKLSSGTDPFKKFVQLFPAGSYKGTTLSKSDCFLKVEGGENEEYISVKLLRAMNTSPTNAPQFSVAVERDGGGRISMKDYKETISGQDIKSGFSLYVNSLIASSSTKKYDIEVEAKNSGTRLDSFSVSQGAGPVHGSSYSCQNLSKLKQ